MVGGINPFGFFLIPALAMFIVSLAPAVYFPWKGFCAYVVVAVSAAVLLWFATGHDSFALATGFTIMGSALLVGWVVQVSRRRKTEPLRPRPMRSATLLLAATITLVAGIQFTKWVVHKSRIPSAYADASAVYLPRKVVTDCEISVWQSSVSSLALGPGAGWTATPYHTRREAPDRRDLWLNGVGCSLVDEKTKTAIIDALNSPGSMYRVEQGRGVILIPSRGYIVHSYNHP